MHPTRADSMVMRNVTAFYGLLACSWEEATGLDSVGEPRGLFPFTLAPSLDFFPLLDL